MVTTVLTKALNAWVGLALSPPFLLASRQFATASQAGYATKSALANGDGDLPTKKAAATQIAEKPARVA